MLYRLEHATVIERGNTGEYMAVSSDEPWFVNLDDQDEVNRFIALDIEIDEYARYKGCRQSIMALKECLPEGHALAEAREVVSIVATSSNPEDFFSGGVIVKVDEALLEGRIDLLADIDEALDGALVEAIGNDHHPNKESRLALSEAIATYQQDEAAARAQRAAEIAAWEAAGRTRTRRVDRRSR